MPAKIESPAETPDSQYREMLINLLKRQVTAEMGATAMYAKAVGLAPTYMDKIHSARVAYEESTHVRGVAGVLTDLGVDVEAFCRADLRLLRATLLRSSRSISPDGPMTG